MFYFPDYFLDDSKEFRQLLKIAKGAFSIITLTDKLTVLKIQGRGNKDAWITKAACLVNYDPQCQMFTFTACSFLRQY